VKEDQIQRKIRARIQRAEDKRRYVGSLFGRIAGRYDLTNDVMSLGLHRRWKRLALGIAEVRSGDMVLDLAAGTGDFAIRASALGATVIAADLTREMMWEGTGKRGAETVSWLQADAMRLPLVSESIDRVLIGYGLRNFPDLGHSLAEIYRCLKPGGRLVALDFGRAEPPALHRAYLRYLELSTSVAGRVLHGDPESYLYIPESLRQYPAQQGVTELMQRAGYAGCGHIDLIFGTMAINFGDKPG
jgi:demethylmenaquinone methyltransferase / 2-methoxy-6-polyprenyl-1,4-benzoquinol methylase